MSGCGDSREAANAESLPHPATAYVFQLFVAINRLRDTLLDKALRPLGLNVNRHRAISVIAILEPCTMSQLADLSVVDRTTMTRIVDQLVARGLAKRETPSEDRRQVLIRLTAAGRKTHESAVKRVSEVNEAALQGLADDTVQFLAQIEQSVLKNLATDAPLARRLLAFRRE